MTKAEYIDFIRNSLPQVDQTSRFHHKQVAAAINVAVNAVYWEMYDENPAAFRKGMERYSTNAKLDLGLSDGRYVADLTVDIVDLPRKAGGILGVKEDPSLGTTTTTTQFVPVSTTEGEQLYGSEGSLPGNVVGYSWAGYERDGVRAIEFWGATASPIANGVIVRYIKQFKSYTSTQTFIPPFGQDQLIIDKVREFMGATPPKDTVNDNADTNG